MSYLTGDTRIREVIIHYKDGESAEISLPYVMQYEIDNSEEINPRISIKGTGCGMPYLISSMREGKPLLISREMGASEESDIEEIINTHQIRKIQFSRII